VSTQARSACWPARDFRDFHATGFTKILCNPPYHTDFSVAKPFIEKVFNRLLVGGAMWLVTKLNQHVAEKLGTTSLRSGNRVRQSDLGL